MATIAPPRPTEERPGLKPEDGGRGPGFPSGPELGGEDRPGDGPDFNQRYYTGMWVGLAAIVMLFTAFTSAYVVRKGVSDDWQPLSLPPLLWVNTIVLVLSSVTLAKARRSFSSLRRFQGWWVASIMLGGVFLAGQLVVWQQLAARGVYVDTNPSSSFFYVLTATHGIHLAGGVAALLWLTGRLWYGNLTRVAVDVTSLYWHFMDGLWVYLMLLLLIWR